MLDRSKVALGIGVLLALSAIVACSVTVIPGDDGVSGTVTIANKTFSYKLGSTGVFEIWAGEFDYMVEHEQSGVFTLTMHPQVIGRGHRIPLLERFIQHVLSRDAVRFARMGDVANELWAAEREEER